MQPIKHARICWKSNSSKCLVLFHVIYGALHGFRISSVTSREAGRAGQQGYERHDLLRRTSRTVGCPVNNPIGSICWIAVATTSGQFERHGDLEQKFCEALVIQHELRAVQQRPENIAQSLSTFAGCGGFAGVFLEHGPLFVVGES